jgi:hypothetical protein
MDSITNKQVYNIYTKQNDTSRKLKVSATVSILEEQCKMANVDWVLSSKRFHRESKVNTMVEKRQAMSKKSRADIEAWENSVFVKLQPLEDPVEPSIEDAAGTGKRGRPPKRLSENPGDKTSHKILDQILNNLTCAADEQNISTGTLLRALSDRWAQRNRGESSKEATPDMPVLSACAMIYNLNLSVNQYQELRLEMMTHGFMLPVRNTIDTFKKSLLPPSVLSESVKTSCDLVDVISQTVHSLLEVQEEIPVADVKVIAKFGLDGSGSHKIRHQVVDRESSEDSSSDEEEEKETTSYLAAFWCPLHIRCGDETLWSNPLPNSILYARPVCLVREKETRESVEQHFKPHMDKLAAIEKGVVQVEITNGRKAQVVTELSMMDGKMIDLIQGDSGAFCHYCNATRADANDIIKIQNGFKIEKTAEKCREIWESIESGEILYSDKCRVGQVHKPLNTRDIRFYGITHQKLRSLDHMEKLLYHLVSGQTHTWSETEFRVKDALKIAKKVTIKHIRKKLGFLIDTPTSGGGNTDTGGIAERFFSRESREDICVLINKESDRDAFSKLLGMYEMVLSVCQNVDASKIAIPTEVRVLCQELMIFEKTSFPWAYISPSVHSMCGHNPELFEITGGAPIAIYSEQGSEAWNKHIRAFKSGPAARARQTSIQENIHDIFNRMMLQTHPKIATRKRQVQCGRCERLGHTIRSCSLLVSSVLDLEATRVQKCFK